MVTKTYVVRGMTCGHCVSAVESEIGMVSGVERVSADLATGVVRVAGDGFEDSAVRTAIADAGYETE